MKLITESKKETLSATIIGLILAALFIVFLNAIPVSLKIVVVDTTSGIFSTIVTYILKFLLTALAFIN